MSATRVTPNPHRWVDAPTVYGLGMSDRLAVQSLVAEPGKPKHDAVSIRSQYDRLVHDGYALRLGGEGLRYFPTPRSILACRPSVADAGLLLPGDVLASGDVVDVVWEHATYYAVNVHSEHGTPLIRTFDKGWRVSLREAAS